VQYPGAKVIFDDFHRQASRAITALDLPPVLDDLKSLITGRNF
jgi:hypothetical protein